jgi:putative ATP-dependent endonuclease of OLD family
MYLKNIKLNSFRSFDQGEIELHKDLTVFVGENNGGKSNAIDAVRLLIPAAESPDSWGIPMGAGM